MSTAEQLRVPVIQLKSILFAIDFTPGSLHAFPFAISLARHYAAGLLLEHVMPNEGTLPLSETPAVIRHRMQAEIETALVRSHESLNGIAHEIHFDRGNISSRLLATARERHTDLVILGTSGLRGMKKLLKGSTAEEIVFLATCPVLTVGPNVDRRPDFRRILCATDFSPAARKAIPYAISLAEIYNASLLFLHVNDWNSKEPPIAARPRTHEFVREELHRSIHGAAVESRSQIVVDFGPSTDLIVEVAADREADLIVIGRPAVNGIKARIASRLPGSTAYDVISQAPCPVLTVPLRHAA